MEGSGTAAIRETHKHSQGALRTPSFTLRGYLLNNRFDGEPSGVNDIAGLRRALEGRGVQFLDNRAVRLEGTDTYLVGIEDLLQGEPDLQGGLQSVRPDAPTILLSHNPDIIAMPAAGQADLILSGHTHGGQIVLPLLGPVYTQTEQLTRSEASGYWRHGKTHVYVHRGLGESIPIRIGAPPHVTLLTLLPAPGRASNLSAAQAPVNCGR